MHPPDAVHLPANPDDRRDRLQFLVGIAPVPLLRLLWHNRFQVARCHWRDLGQLLCLSLLTLACNTGDRWRHGRKLRRTQITVPPVFIVGHWRSGTTLLHKLLSLDAAFCAPTFFECCLPRGFVSGRRMLKPRIVRHLPRAARFDVIPLDVDEPFEDEFVLAREALLSPMLATVFPDRGPAYRRQLCLDGLTADERRRWRQTLLDFARKLTLVHGQRLLFKSPAHSCRIPELRRLFPGAKFIALQRQPLDVIASTLRMESELLRHNALQRCAHVPDEDWVLARYLRVQGALERARSELPAADFATVEYADLCAAPRAVLAAIYARLGLEPCADLWRTLAAYLAKHGQLQARSSSCTAEQRARWQRTLAEAQHVSSGGPRSVRRTPPHAAAFSDPASA